MGHPLLDERIRTLKIKKSKLLKMKKSERGDELKTTDNIISRLVRWNRELLKNN